MQILAFVIVFSAKNVIYLQKNISENAFVILKKSSEKTLALFKKIMYNV